MAHTTQLTWFAIRNQDEWHDAPAQNEGVFCVENIGVNERRMRRMFGVLNAIAASVLAIALLISGVDQGWRLALFLPGMLSAFGFLQAHERT